MTEWPSRLVAVLAEMRRRPAKHEATPAACEAEQHVLGPAGQDTDVLERAVRQTLLVHPLPDSIEIDEGRIDGGLCHGVPPSTRITAPLVKLDASLAR